MRPARALRARSSRDADWAVVALVSCAVGCAMASLFATAVWWDLSISLDVAPWRQGQECALAGAVKAGGCCEEQKEAAALTGKEAPVSALTCPFIPGEEATEQCAACGAIVSKQALHDVR